MSLAHPRTMALVDPGLPVVSTLLGLPHPPALQAAVDTTGGQLTDVRITQVSWWPGRSITVRYSVSITGGTLPGEHAFVCVAGRIPEGSLLVESDLGTVGVWRVPYDPALPGMAAAVDNDQVSQLLVDLGSTPGLVTTRLRAYRPRRRAVVQVTGAEHSIFLKVVRPDRVDHLHQIHRTLSATLPIPSSFGVDDAKGIVAMQALPGATLRHILENPSEETPPIAHILGLVDSLPAPRSDKVTSSPIERLPSTVRMLSSITPELAPRLQAILERIGEETAAADHPVHGDFYESQIMVADGRITGLVDVDTYGWGRPADDAATMLGHMSIWAGMSANPDRVRTLGSDLLRMWDTTLDPIDLRLRTAAMTLSLASGPFRVQSAAWPSEVAHRVSLAELWIGSEDREKTLIPL